MLVRSALSFMKYGYESGVKSQFSGLVRTDAYSQHCCAEVSSLCALLSGFLACIAWPLALPWRALLCLNCVRPSTNRRLLSCACLQLLSCSPEEIARFGLGDRCPYRTGEEVLVAQNLDDVSRHLAALPCASSARSSFSRCLLHSWLLLLCAEPVFGVVVIVAG
jgi:hypothetical protein